MSDPQFLSPNDSDDVLAAEYVLGVIDRGLRATTQDRLRRDSRFAARVAAWADRLAPLDEATPEVAPPPDMLPRIEARLFPAPDQPRALWLWLALAGGALVLAAVAAALLLAS